MPKCPYCHSDLVPSEKYPGKYLCYTCKKRFPASVVEPDEEPDANAETPVAPVQPPVAEQPAMPMQPPQPAQPAQRQWQQPERPQQEERQWQQPQVQPDQFQQQWQQQEQPDQFQQQWQQQGQPEQQWQQQVQPGQFQQAQQTAGFQQQAQQDQHPMGSQSDFNGMTQAARDVITQNGGSGGLFSYLFVMPDKMKLQQIAMSYGDQLTWYKILVYGLVFLSCVLGCLSALNGIGNFFATASFGGRYLLPNLLNVIVSLIPIPFYLVVRKRMALFTKGSWAELILVYMANVVLSVVNSIVTAVLYGGLFGGFLSGGLIGSVIMGVIVAAINWIYFSKRDAYFDYENAAIGCKPSGVASRMAQTVGSMATSANNAMGAQPAQGQQWQGDPSQQQWQQRPQQWQQQQPYQQAPQQWQQQGQQPQAQPEQFQQAGQSWQQPQQNQQWQSGPWQG